MKAMVLAAGRGTRLKTLTQTCPKPLVEVAGRPVIEHTLLHLAQAGIRDVVINVHHLGKRLMERLGDGTQLGINILWSPEVELLETGGGVCNALPLLGDDPFLVVNGDIMWDLDLTPLMDHFGGVATGHSLTEHLDVVLGLVPNPSGFKGDFLCDAQGVLQRAHGVGPWTYCGIQMIHPRALQSFPVEPFSLNRLYDAAMKRGRLRGQPLQGRWIDMGTPERLARAERIWPRESLQLAG